MMRRLLQRFGIGKGPGDSTGPIFMGIFQLARAAQEERLSAAWVEAAVARVLKQNGLSGEASGPLQRLARFVYDRPELTEDHFRRLVREEWTERQTKGGPHAEADHDR